MTRFYLIRHGETDCNLGRRYCSRTDVPLNRTGEMQTSKLRGRFAGIQVEAVYSSDLQRAVRTAEIMFPGYSVTQSSLLRELDFGQWEGLTYEEVLAKDGNSYRAWLDNPALSFPPEGEHLDELADRTNLFIRKTAEEFPDSSVAVVSHAGPIRAILCESLGISLSAIWRIAIDAASVSIIEFQDRKPYVRLVNDTCHLREK